MNTARVIACVLVLAVAASCVHAADIYNYKKSYIMPITQLNFKNQVQKIRETTNQVTILQFYRENDGKSRNFAKEFDEFTTEYRGAFRIGACNCDAEPYICEQEKIQSFPTFRVYPPVPIPPIDFEEELSAQNILKLASRYLNSNAIEITSANHNTFVSESPSVPKVFLFTDKKGVPLIYKGLSVAFEKKLFFGIVRKEDDILTQKYNVKKFPTILVVKANENKPKVYSGEMKFSPIFDFLNIYSEVFVPGGSEGQESAATKSWLTEIVPEMHTLSANDICLKQEGVLCVILLSNGKPDRSYIEMLKDINSLYDRKISRGLQYKFMWLDVSNEQAWGKLFQYEGNQPKLVILNPGARKRYAVHEGALELSELKNTFERINGGDARFVRIQEDLPSFSFRKDLS